MKNSLKSLAKLFVCIIAYIFVAFPALVCAMFAKIFVHDLWLIQEDGWLARDNGYYFFKFVCEKYPKQKVVYVIKKSSPDYNKIKSLGKSCGFKTFGHWFYYFLSSKEITTQPHNKPGYYINKHFWQNKTIFLQHGVIRDFTSYTADNMKFKMFVTTAFAEDKFIKENYGFKEEVIKLVGLARYDNLLINNINKKQILIMPTWRNYLNKLDEKRFSETDYFMHWNGLLNNDKLLKILNGNDLHLVFYPHRNMQKYVAQFKSISERIIVADIEHFDVQQLLKESAMLITDYSSVFFDMAYMKKPVIWYHFDEKSYFSKHHDKGYFSEDDKILGEKVLDENNLINALNKNIKEEFKLTKKQKDDIVKFFKFFDGKNCERTFDAIKKL